MRVALDATPLVGARTGVGRFVAGLVEALDARDDIELGAWIASARSALARTGVAGGVELPVTRLPVPARVATWLWRHTDRPAHERFVGAVDVVHGTNFVVPPTRSAARVVTVHDLSYVHYRDELAASVAGFDDMVAWAVRGGAAVHVPSRFVAAEISERYPGADVTVIAEGAPPPRPREAPGGPPTILSVATALRRKRLPLLVDAFGLVAAEPGLADARLCLVGGDGPDSDAIAAALGRLPPGVRPRVSVPGRVDDATLRRLLATAAVVAVPSVYEGFGLPVLEAMAVGVPVVAADAASLPEVAGDAAVLVAADDTGALAAGLAAVLSDDALAARTSAAGRDRAARFSWEDTAAGLVGLYGRIAGRM